MSLIPKSMKKVMTLLLLLTSTLNYYAHAQGSSITGRITNEKGEALVGTIISELGTTNRANSDEKGAYKISLTGENPVLVFSHIGYKEQEHKVSKQAKFLDVIMELAVSEMDEAVVVGFGQQRKISVVGAQSSLNAKDIKMPTGNLSSAISGRIAGVVAVQRTGEPGHDNSDIWIRGISTLAGQSSRPLILVDGVERSFNNIDPEDIESFTVLKDASATAVYGVRGANGVIIIKTKPGRVGKPMFSVDYYHSLTRMAQKVKMADAFTYMDVRNDAYINTYGTPRYSPEYIEATKKSHGLLANDNTRLYNEFLYPAVDWMDALFNDWGNNQRFNMSVRGGAPNANYYVSLSHYDETGLTKNFELENFNTAMKYQRYNFTSNLNLRPTNTTTIDLGFSGYLSSGHYPQQSSGSLYGGAMAINPVYYPLMMPNGGSSGRNKDALLNPYSLLSRGGYNREFTNQLNSNIRVNQDLGFLDWSKGISATAMVAFDVFNSRTLNYGRGESLYFFGGKQNDKGIWIEDTLYDDEGNYYYDTIRESSNELNFSSGNGISRTAYVEAALNYDREFGAHRFGGLLLYNQRVYWNLSAGDIVGSLPYKQRGYAGRITYSWNDRYFVESNLGINGSENFTPNKRYGVFPAFGLGWAISNEKFWEPISETVSFLKFRYTDGWVGSDAATGRRFMYQGIMENQPGAHFGAYNYAGGWGISKYGVDVTWSKSRKQNLGIDVKFLNNSLSFVVDLFKERRDNIFLQRSTIPNYAGFVEAPYANLGIVENKGIEIQVEYNKRFGSKTMLSLRGNFTTNEDKIIENDKPAVQYPWLETRGTPVLARWGFIADGLFTSQEEIENHATQFGTVRIGDIKYRDLNGDGVIDDNDLTVIGRGDVPKIYYGFGGDLQVGNFSFGAIFQGTAKADRHLSGSSIHPFSSDLGEDNLFSNITDRWSPDNPTNQDVFYPRLYNGKAQNANNYKTSTWWQKDMSFIRLKQVNITYFLPKKWMENIFIKDASIYMMGTNLFTWSKFKLWDPEANTNNGTAYPNVSSYSIGAKFSF